MSIENNNSTESSDSLTTETSVVTEEQTQSVEVQPESVPFMEQIPQIIRDLPEFENVSDADTFVTKIQELRNKSIAPESYDLPLDDGNRNGELYERFTAAAKEANLTQDQASKIVEMWNDITSKTYQQNEQTHAASINSLQKEWGKDYDKNLNAAQTVVKHFGSQEFIEMLNKSGLGNNPELVKVFHGVSMLLNEDTAVGLADNKVPNELETWHGMKILDFKM